MVTLKTSLALFFAMSFGAFAQSQTCSVVDVDNAANDNFTPFAGRVPVTGKWQKTYGIRPVASGEVAAVLINNSGLVSNQYSSAMLWPTTATLGMTVTVNGEPAPMYEVTATKYLYLTPALKAVDGMVIFQVPFQITGATATLEFVGGNCDVSVTVPVAQNAPGFYGGPLIQDVSSGAINGPNSPLIGVNGYGYIAIYGYGLGQLTSAVPAGVPAPMAANPLQGTSVTLAVDGGQPAEVLYAGIAPGSIGQYEVIAQVPSSTAPEFAYHQAFLFVNGTQVAGFNYWVEFSYCR